MLRNYLAAAVRNLVRNRIYAMINIVGLAVGLAAALLIMLFVRDEFSYDTWIPEYEQVYAVHDVGASFGTTGVVRNLNNARGNLKAYDHSRFITKTTSKKVNFATPGRPTFWLVFNPPRYFMRLSLRSIGHNVPRADAKWMGDLLGGLSPQQIRDAFRGAGYSPEEVEGFARTVEGRIAALRAL